MSKPKSTSSVETYAETWAREHAHNALQWIKRADTYGTDMLSSRKACLKDAEECLQQALEALKNVRL